MDLGGHLDLSMMMSLDHAIDLEMKMLELCPDATASPEKVCEQDGIMEKLKGAKRQCIALTNSLDIWTDCKAGGDVITKMRGLLDKKAKTTTSRVSHLSSCKEASYLAELQCAMQALKSIAGGRRDGAAWSDGVDKKTTWKTLSKKWGDGELMDVEPTDLETGISECEKVMTKTPWELSPRTSANAPNKNASK